MLRASNYFVLICLVPLTVHFAQGEDWRWAGYEVIGSHSVHRDKILQNVPVKVGSNYKEDPSAWDKWCANLRVQFNFHATRCSSVRYLNFQAYLVVEIVEVGNEQRMVFRRAPIGDIAFASETAVELHDRLYKRIRDLFDLGIGIQESGDKGYLDYNDPQMREMVLELIQHTPPIRNNLLEILSNDRDTNKRAKAANLLNWTISNLSETIVKVTGLLDDPEVLVRNNISRFALQFVHRLADRNERHGVIDRLLIQLDRPSHADRNKAIYNLIEIVKVFPEDRSYVNAKGRELIRYIAGTSVLENVRDPAQEILEKLDQVQK